MAKFLQETLRESGLKANAHIVGSDAFKEFFRKVPPHFVMPFCLQFSSLYTLGPVYWRIALGSGHYQRRQTVRR